MVVNESLANSLDNSCSFVVYLVSCCRLVQVIVVKSHHAYEWDTCGLARSNNRSCYRVLVSSENFVKDVLVLDSGFDLEKICSAPEFSNRAFRTYVDLLLRTFERLQRQIRVFVEISWT